jgi:HEAT repeat protein
MWEIISFLLAGGAAVGSNVWSSIRKGERRLEAWRETATSCGLHVAEVYGRSGFKAWAGRLEVQIELDREERARIVVVIPGPRDFQMVRIGSQSLLAFAWARDTKLGDAAFDNRFSLEGPKGLIFALLDAETRRLLLSLDAEGPLEVSGGSLRAEMVDEKVPRLLPLVLDLGGRLAQAMDVEVPRRLAENAARDPEVEVRLQSLLLLVRELPEHPATAEALRTACSDTNPEIRLRAAEALGAEGRGLLLKLAESSGYDAVSARAISILDGELPFERVPAILDRALHGHRLQTARVCVEALGRRGGTAAVGPLANVVAHERGELAAVAAQILGTIGNAEAEPPLILALQRDIPDLRMAAARALGRVGSVAAVLPLKETAERFSHDRGLRQATRQAIAEIQSRLPGATPGELSLAGAEMGQLSLAQDEAGELSLATDQAGELSLAPAEPEQSSPGGDEDPADGPG